jgi:hypothetical protein
MPRTRKPRHTYAVYSVAYATAAVKEQVERGALQITQPEQLGGQLVYMGDVERTAAWHFYRAVRAAYANPLVFMVVLHRDRQVVARARPEPL